MPFDSARGRFVEEPSQHGEVVLLIVDGLLRPRRRRPCEGRVSGLARMLLELVMVRHPAGSGAHHVQCVEGRHPRARFTQLNPWIRNVESIGGSASGQLQQQPFRRETLALHRQLGIDGLAHAIEHHGIFARLLREHPFGQPGNEHHAEASTASLLRRPHEHAPVAVRWRFRLHRQQPFGKNAARFVKVDGPNLAHRTKIGEHAQNVGRRLQDARHQCLEPIEPLAPRRARGPAGQVLDDRQRKCLQILQLPLYLPESGNSGLVTAIVSHRLADLSVELSVLSFEATRPA